MTLIKVSPEEIVFPNVLNQESVFVLKLKNTATTAVAFKVKTTAPKNYLVKPSAGVIAANGSTDVKITLNKQTSDPSANNDRFLVQAVSSESGKELGKEEWAVVDKASVQELRLHVVFSGSGNASGGASSVVALDKNASPDQVRSKYDELVAFSSQLEKDKKRIESELDSCKSQLKRKPVVNTSAGGFSVLQLLIAMILAVVLSRFAATMGY